MEQLVFLAGLLLSQSFFTANDTLVAVPAGVLDVHGQAHVLRYEEQSPIDAFGSVKAALMMHARDASRYGLVEPGYLGTPDRGQHELQVSERGSTGDLSIRFSLTQDGDATVFEVFDVRIAGQRLDADEYTVLRTELQRGYNSLTQGGVPLPDLPKSPRLQLPMI